MGKLKGQSYKGKKLGNTSGSHSGSNTKQLLSNLKRILDLQFLSTAEDWLKPLPLHLLTHQTGTSIAIFQCTCSYHISVGNIPEIFPSSQGPASAGAHTTRLHPLTHIRYIVCQALSSATEKQGTKQTQIPALMVLIF